MTAREQLLQEVLPASFAIAYRMLGRVSEAEDVVQEALLRVYQALDATPSGPSVSPGWIWPTSTAGCAGPHRALD